MKENSLFYYNEQKYASNKIYFHTELAIYIFYNYLIVIILSPFLSFCLSTSIWAPVTSCIAVMLHPPLPIILETTEAGTDNFFDLKNEDYI